MKRVTIADVAAKAGVSKSTVSHALSNKRPISEATKEKIQQAIVELDYEPSPIAQKLAGAGDTRNVGFALPLILPALDGLEIKFIASAAQTISERGYTFVLISEIEHGPKNLIRFIDNGVVDGFILMQVQMHDPRIEVLSKRNVPLVLIGRCEDTTGINYVDSDIHLGMADSVGHLAELGHQHIVYLYQDNLEFGFASRALKSFQEICADLNLDAYSAPCELTAESGEAVFNQVLDAHPQVSAVMVWNDTATMGVFQAAGKRGIRVPQDISVIYTNDTALSHMLPYQPTQIDIRPDVLAAKASEMLICLLEGTPVADTQVLIPPRFVVGRSTAPAKR